MIDTGFFVALPNKNDTNHENAISILPALLEKKYGTRITIDYIVDEAITVTWVRTKNKARVREVYELFYGDSAIVQVEKFPIHNISDSWEIFQKYSTKRKPLSFNDCSLIAFAIKKGIKKIISFDSEFDGILERIDGEVFV